MIDFAKYQEFVRGGLSPNLDQQGLVILGCMGLAGESGEVIDHFKKALFHTAKPLDGDAVVLELGDVLWYIACLCIALGVDMGKIAEENQRKLRERYPERYKPAAKDKCESCGGQGFGTGNLFEGRDGADTRAEYRCLMGHEWLA